MKDKTQLILSDQCMGEGGIAKLEYDIPAHSIRGTEVTELRGFKREPEAFIAGLKKVRERSEKGGYTYCFSFLFRAGLS